MRRQGSGQHEHVSPMIVRAKPSSPGTEGKLMNVDAREVDFVCERGEKMEGGEEEMRVTVL